MLNYYWLQRDLGMYINICFHVSHGEYIKLLLRLCSAENHYVQK